MEQAVVTAALTAVPVLASAVAALFWMVIRLQESDKKCQIRVARLEAEIQRLNEAQEEGLIIVDAQIGTILRWPLNATFLLQHHEKHMLGKHIPTIVPERLRAMFQQAWDQWIADGRPVPRRGPFDVVALAKDNSEVPVSLCLASWKEGEKTIIAVRIRSRKEDSVDATSIPN